MRHNKPKRKGQDKRSKAKSLKSHAKRRFWERYGIQLTNNLENDIIKQITRGKAPLIDRQSTNRSIYRIMAENQSIPVLYDRKRKCIITALMNEHIKV